MNHGRGGLGDMDHRSGARIGRLVNFLQAAWLLRCSRWARGIFGAVRRIMLPKTEQKWRRSRLCLIAAGLAGRQEVDRVNDRHGDDVFLGAEVEGADAIDDLIGQRWRIHGHGVQFAQGHGSIRFYSQS